MNLPGDVSAYHLSVTALLKGEQQPICCQQKVNGLVGRLVPRFSSTMVTLEILLIEWQQNYRFPESAKIQIVSHYFSSETVQIWLR